MVQPVSVITPASDRISSIQHPNHLIVAAVFYSPNLSATINKRSPKHILHDPDDQITTDNAPYKYTQLTFAQRLRRRRRGPRLLTSFGCGLTPRSEACGLVTVRNPFTPIVDDPFISSSPRVQTFPGRAPFRGKPTSPHYTVKINPKKKPNHRNAAWQ
ncbi:jg20788 [Pararge aegeria aegeria]|uniref:Jg20788 protein n=1 Tax=Pararge aegeria aegeria TaxID=348720 RepID=A0A8S4R5P6_9NEOP|nr:jg20788 [Pararge aegeria aegeria]